MVTRLLAAAVLFLAGLTAPGLAAPARVVSLNLCTDQLAMMLAAPGQLVSVSWLARDPASSAMAAEARRYTVNRAGAEEVLLIRPDLVLAGSWTAPSTLRMLRDHGLRVEVFAPDADIAGIRANILRMGKVLGRDAEAQRLIARFDADLSLLSDPAPGPRPRAALYAVNGYSSGHNSLAGQIIALAGFDNIADELGLPAGGILALERLLIADPDLLVEGRRYPGAARGQELLEHPALKALGQDKSTVVMSDPDWVCGTPYILRAVAQMREARLALQEGP